MMPLLELKVNGAVFHASVIDVRVEAAMSATATCDITIAASRTGDDTPKPMLPDGMAIGKEIQVMGGDSASSMVRVFVGTIMSISWEIDVQRGEFVVVRAMDESYKLWTSAPRRALLQQSYKDAISKIASEVGLSAKVDGTAFMARHEYQLQTSSSGEMLHTIMGRTGGYWTAEGKNLIVRDGTSAPSAVVEVAYSENLLRLKARVAGIGGASSVGVRSWDASKTQVVAGKNKRSDKDVVLPSGLSNHLDKLDEQMDRAGALSSHHVVADVQGADSIAASLHRRAKASQLQVRIERAGAADLDKLRPGAAVEVKGVGSELNGKYRVASVVHTYNSSGWRSIINTGTLEPATLPELAVEAARAPAWSRQGPVVGIVSNNSPSDKKMAGMVKVKFATIGDQIESDWARVVSVGGGKDRGMLFIPEVDDEVLVVFEQGDPTRPLVLGGLWSEKNGTPFDTGKYIDGGKVKVWSMKSRSGQHITVTDGGSDKDQHVEIAMPGEKIKLHVGKDKVELWAGDKTLEVKAGEASILLDDQGSMTLKAQKITLKATQDVNIEGMNVNIKANTNFKAEGSVGAEVKGGATGKFEASGPLALKGAVVNIN